MKIKNFKLTLANICIHKIIQNIQWHTCSVILLSMMVTLLFSTGVTLAQLIRLRTAAKAEVDNP